MDKLLEKRQAAVAKIQAAKTKEELDVAEKELRAVEDEIAVEKRKQEIVAASSNVPDGMRQVGGSQTENTENKADEKRRQALYERNGRATYESRAILLSGGTLATPTRVGVNVQDIHNPVSGIVDAVMYEDLTGVGQYDEPLQWTDPSAVVATEGTAPTASDPTFKKASIKPILLAVVTNISREIRKQTPTLYESKVVGAVRRALYTKMSQQIIAGSGSSQFYGIYNAVTTDSTALYTTKEFAAVSTKGSITPTTLRTLIMAYGGDENFVSDATLVLNKTDLEAFANLRGTNEKKAIYDVTPDGSNPSRGTIAEMGSTFRVKYIINSNVVALEGLAQTAAAQKTMIYGDLSKYKVGLFGNVDVLISEDEKMSAGLIVIRGEVTCGGNVVQKNAFVIATLAASA